METQVTRNLYTTNVVCMGVVRNCTRLDLNKLANTECNIVYNPSRFSAAVWHHRKISKCCLIFSNGKMICTGQSYNEAKSNIKKYARLLQKKGYVTQERVVVSIKKITMSMTYSFGKKVSLVTLSQEIGDALYSPDMYNGMIVKRSGVSIIVFTTGKVIITGVKSDKQVDRIILPLILDIELLCET